MKKFGYNIFFFLAIILLFNGILFLFAFSKYHKGYKKRPDKSFDTFILSDSHGLPLGKFSEKYNVFNFSDGSDSYFDMKRKILFLLENEYNVNTIYITVDDHSLSLYRENINNLDRSSAYSLPNEYNSYYEYIKLKYIEYYFPIFQPKIATLFKFYLKDKMKAICQPNRNSLREKDWIYLSEYEKTNNAKNRMKLQFPSDNKSFRLEKALLEIIYLCKTHGIKLIGVKFPLSNTYSKVLGNRGYGADELIAAKGLKVIDKKEIFIDNPEYFRNQDHLNTKGAKVFSKILFNE